MKEFPLDGAQLTALLGAALVIFGTVTPLIHVPIAGSISYALNGRGDGMLVLALAVCCGFLAYYRKYFWLAWGTLLIALVCLLTFYQLQSALWQMQDKLNSDLKDNPFRGLAQAFAGSIGLGWGWAFLIVGIGCLGVGSGLGVKNSALPDQAKHPNEPSNQIQNEENDLRAPLIILALAVAIVVAAFASQYLMLVPALVLLTIGIANVLKPMDYYGFTSRFAGGVAVLVCTVLVGTILMVRGGPPISDTRALGSTLTDKADAPAVPATTAEQPFTVVLIEKGFRPADFEAHEYRDAITMKVAFKNLSGKDVRAFEGVLTFTDLLDNEIFASRLAVNDAVAANASMNWEGGVDYNQFMEKHRGLRAADQASLKTRFVVTKILFSDGTTKTY